MEFIHAEILLMNGEDVILARRHLIAHEEIRQISVNMLIDSGAYMMCVNENIQALLDLPVMYKKRFQLAEGTSTELNIVGPVQVKLGDNIISCDAIVLPGNSEPLFGAIPMEEMDVMVHPNKQELIFKSEQADYFLNRM